MKKSGSVEGPGKQGSGKPGSGKVANGLVAMSCAGVLAVYAAGYVRTRSAAEQLDAQSVERRVAQDAPREESARAEVRPGENRQEERRAPESVPAASDPREIAELAPAPTVSNAPSPAPSHAPAVEVFEPAAAPAPVAVAPVAPVAVPVVSAPVAQAPVATPVPEPKLVAVSIVAPPAPAPAPPPAPKWKDGTYYGWGTSRHGDIQAEVVVAGGRIASATISDCRTRYPCSVIDRLPPEVAQRQSPEVDYISRATQSTNAFYYAVVEALGKAK